MSERNRFQADLTKVLNRYCEENQSNTPDFILADFIRKALDSLNDAVRERDVWYGGAPEMEPGEPVLSVELGSDQHAIYQSDLEAFDRVLAFCHVSAKAAGWWDDPATGEALPRNKAEMIALEHSELSEKLEAARKDHLDAKLPEYHGEVVESIDCFIRMGDYLFGFWPHESPGRVMADKLRFNQNRADHKPENRVRSGGKKF